jgi:hypothetical protein
MRREPHSGTCGKRGPRVVLSPNWEIQENHANDDQYTEHDEACPEDFLRSLMKHHDACSIL